MREDKCLKGNKLDNNIGRLNMKNRIYREDLIFEIFVLFVVALSGFYLAANISMDQCPDEYMRYPLAQWIAANHKLPTGFEKEIVNPVWGTSYGFAPYFPQIVGAVFMNIMSLFKDSDFALLFACRSVSVLSCTGAVFFCFRASRYVFQSRAARLLFPVIVGFLPQVTFLSCYVNNDAPSLFCSCMILYALLRGRNRHWDIKSCVLLAVGLSLAAITYYFCCGWIVISVIFYFYTVLTDETLNSGKEKWKRLLSHGFLIAGICLVLAGWYYIRNAVIYDGDILGFNQSSICRSIYSQAEGKTFYAGGPWKDTGKGFFEMVFSLRGPAGKAFPEELPFVFSTYCSFIGVFGYFSIWLSTTYYKLYTVLFALGAAAFFFIPKKKNVKSKNTVGFWLCMLAAMVIPVFLSAYNSFNNDYSPQGRYIISLLPALACVLCRGFEKAGDLNKNKAVRFLPSFAAGEAWILFWLASYFGCMIPELL